MPSKETGAMFICRCPNCGDELVLGWLRPGHAVPSFDPKANKKIGIKDVNDFASDEQSCTCGNVKARFDKQKGRAVFDWVDAEPMIGNINLH